VKPFTRQALLASLETAVKWVEDTREHGPKAEDQGNNVTDWFDELKDL